MTTPPTTLHERIAAELARRTAVANAADPGPWQVGQEPNNGRVFVREPGSFDWVGTVFAAQRSNQTRPNENAAHIALHDPADALRRYAGELEVLERHEPTYQIPTSEGGIRWVCKSRCKPEICVELKSLASRLGVSVDG